jgi:uncharacterized protein (DUF2062 family)
VLNECRKSDGSIARAEGVVRRWAEPVVAAIRSSLRQELTPERIALSLAVGAAVGLFPLVGTTTLLGLALGSALRLNLPLLQAVNWLVYPLQLALVLPLVRLGEWMAGASLVTFAPGASGDTLAPLVRGGLHGLLGWVGVAPLAALVVYALALPLLRASARREASA